MNISKRITIDTQIILKALLALERGGDGITIEQLCELVGDPHLYGKRKYLISSARELAENFANMRFEWKNRTIRALSDSEVAMLPYSAKTGMKIKREIKRSTYIGDFESLADYEKQNVIVERTAMIMAQHSLTEQNLKQISARVKPGMQEIDFDDKMLKYF